MAEKISAKDFYGGVGDWIDIDPETGEEYVMAEVEAEEEAAMALSLSERGGEGSGHYGHAGIPGHQGGSLPGEAGAQGEAKADLGPGGSAPSGVAIDEPIVVGDDPQVASRAGDRISAAIRNLPEVFHPIDILDPDRSGSGWLLPDGSFYGNYNHTVGATAATKAGGVSLQPDYRTRSGSREIDTMLASGIMRITKYGMRTDTPGGLSINLGRLATQEQKSAIRDWLSANPDADVVADYQPFALGAEHVFVSSRMHLAKIGIVERGGPGSGHFGHVGRPGERGGSLPGEVSQEHEPGILGNIMAGDKYKDYVGPSEERLHTAGLRSMAQGSETSPGIDKPTMVWAFNGLQDISRRWFEYNDKTGKVDRQGRPYNDYVAERFKKDLAAIGNEPTYENLLAIHEAIWHAVQGQNPTVTKGPDSGRPNLAAPPGSGHRVVKYEAAEVSTPGPRGESAPYWTAHHGWSLYNGGRGVESWKAKREWDKEHGIP